VLASRWQVHYGRSIRPQTWGWRLTPRQNSVARVLPYSLIPRKHNFTQTQIGWELVASKGKRRNRVALPRRVRLPSQDSSVDYEALARFRYELRKFHAFSEAAAKNAGLTPQQHQALLVIRGFSGKRSVSVGDLARFLLIQHHTAVGLLDRMEKVGLLSRDIDSKDGRRVFAKLTKKGEKRLQVLSKIHLEELHAVGPTLTRILKPFRSRIR
jgi:DNA-binding MarR family transcriptional regulator